MVVGIKYGFGSANPFYVVSSGSMIPTLNVGDMVIIQRGNNNRSYLIVVVIFC